VRLGWAVVAGLALAVACSGPQPPAPETLVARTAERTAALQSVHFRLEVTNGTIQLGPSLEVIKAEGDVARPDRLHVRATARIGGIIVDTDLVHIETATYLLNPFNARWQQLDGGLTPVPLLDPDRGVAQVVRAATDLRADGDETIQGTHAWRVVGKVDTRRVAALVGGDAVPGTVDVQAVVDDTGRMWRLVLRGPIVVGEQAETTRTLDFSQFDAASPIETPPGF
jgi:hypothetical protein